MIEIGGILIRPESVDAVLVAVPSLGMPCSVLLRSGEYLNCHAEFDDIKEALNGTT